MLSFSDFEKKQFLFVFFNKGEKLSFSNDNVIVKTKDGKIKLQCSCYRIFLIYAIGNFTLTSVVIQQSRKFGFFIALMSSSFKMYEMLGAVKDSNTLLKHRQYEYDSLKLAKWIIANKIENQRRGLMQIRNKSTELKQVIQLLDDYRLKLETTKSLAEIMGIEGIAAKLYFRNHFNNVEWSGRQPRLKRDYVNATLDIGYTLLFNFIDSILLSYGFDTYKGVLHRQFYMRKSLVCDLIEPFRILIDYQVKKSINLKQISEDDFIVRNHQYMLKYDKNAHYVSILMQPILESRKDIFLYIQKYYRSFMKQLPIEQYSTYTWR